MEQVQYDWNSLQNEEELKIMHKNFHHARYVLTISMSEWKKKLCNILCI